LNRQDAKGAKNRFSFLASDLTDNTDHEPPINYDE